MSKTVILGAGLTGISAAYHLEKAGYYDYLLFEKENSPGGLCRSLFQDGFTFDFTGHLLHINDHYFRSLITNIIGFEMFEQIQRRSFVYTHNRYTAYPFQGNLKGLPSNVIAECIEGFVKRKHSIHAVSTFREWVLHQFGEGFGKHFFFPYQEKIFAYNINNLTASWTGRFVPPTTLADIIDGIVNDNRNEQVGYNAQFFYPKQGGIASWVEKFASYLINPIQFNHTVTAINLNTKQIRFSNGRTQSYDRLINTMPLDRLIDLLQDKSSTYFKKSQPNLLCNSVINFNIGFNRPDICDKHWIYFPETEIPFYRLGFPHNFSRASVPNGYSSLYGECSFLKRPTEDQQQLLHKAIEYTKKLLSFSQEDIVTQKIVTISHAYVIYNAWRDANLQTLLSELENHAIYSVGRYGAWKYSSMQEAVLDGKDIAQIICSTTDKPHISVVIPNKRTKTKRVRVPNTQSDRYV